MASMFDVYAPPSNGEMPRLFQVSRKSLTGLTLFIVMPRSSEVLKRLTSLVHQGAHLLWLRITTTSCWVECLAERLAGNRRWCCVSCSDAHLSYWFLVASLARVRLSSGTNGK